MRDPSLCEGLLPFHPFTEVIKDPSKDEDEEDDESELTRTNIRFGGPGGRPNLKKTDSDEDSDFD